MAEYLIAYLGGRKPATPEEGAEGMKKWQAWLADLGDAVVNPGTPLSQSQFIAEGGGTMETPDLPLTGFSIVKADDMDGAMAIANECPFLLMGSLQVSQVMKM